MVLQKTHKKISIFTEYKKMNKTKAGGNKTHY